MGRTVLASTRIPFAETISPTARRVVLGLLIVYTGVFIVGSFVAFARYDVR
jgi:hypothetical protein